MINIKITIINKINVKAKASLNRNVYTSTHLELSRVVVAGIKYVLSLVPLNSFTLLSVTPFETEKIGDFSSRNLFTLFPAHYCFFIFVPNGYSFNKFCYFIKTFLFIKKKSFNIVSCSAIRYG